MDSLNWTIEEATVEDAEELGRVHVEIWRQAYAGSMPPAYLAGLDPVAFADEWRGRLADPLPGVVRLRGPALPTCCSTAPSATGRRTSG